MDDEIMNRLLTQLERIACNLEGLNENLDRIWNLKFHGEELP
jgi:hypothetical protein